MLDLGFREDLEFILHVAPGNHRTLTFSATVPKAIEELVYHCHILEHEDYGMMGQFVVR